MRTTVRDRIGAALGAAFVVLISVGNGMATAGTDQSSHPSGEHILRDTIHQHASTSATAGFVMEMLGFAAFIGFLGYLADVTRRRAGGWGMPSATAVVAGVLMLAVKVGSAAPVVALDLDRHTLSPELAQVLNDMNGAAFVVSWLPFAVFVWAAAAALREARAVGRPTYLIGAFLGVVGVPLAVVGLHDVVSATPVAFLLGLLWLLVVSVRLAVKPPAGEVVTLAAPDVRVPVPA